MKLKDLKGREYCGKDCVMFTYNLKVSDECPLIPVTFTRKKLDNGDLSDEWLVTFPMNSGSGFTFNLSFVFQMYASASTLELVCATGLVHVRNFLSDCCSYLQAIDFNISQIVRGLDN